MLERYNTKNLKKAVVNPNLILKEAARPIRPIQNFGWRGIPLLASELVHRHFVSGEAPSTVWEKEWDMLVVLDACRSEWLADIASEYDFLRDVDSIYSVGSHSDEWIDKTFDEQYGDEIEQCAYVTANHHSKWMDPSKFAHFEDVTRYNGGTGLPAPPAHLVTDHAITVGREQKWDRLIVHYMQPHKPFLERGEARKEVSMANDWSTGYEMYNRLFKGDLTLGDIEEGFKQNLRYVLPEVDILRNNVDAQNVAITSDHGNALGERFLWDHSRGVKHPSMRRVPWIKTTANDKNTITPDNYQQKGYDSEKVKENLKRLGYR